MEQRSIATYKRHWLDVRASSLPAGAYVEVIVHDMTNSSPDELLEYVLSGYAQLDAAVGAGMDIGRSFIDEKQQLH